MKKGKNTKSSSILHVLFFYGKIIIEIRRKVGDTLAKIDEWLQEDKLILLEGWARDGLTYEQISNNMGIDTSTLWDWRKKDSNISNALKKGREVVDFEVENALLKNALEGNVTAQIFWLKNRKKEQWREKIEYSNDNVEVNTQIQNIANLLNNPQPNRSEKDVQ